MYTDTFTIMPGSGFPSRWGFPEIFRKCVVITRISLIWFGLLWHLALSVYFTSRIFMMRWDKLAGNLAWLPYRTAYMRSLLFLINFQWIDYLHECKSLFYDSSNSIKFRINKIQILSSCVHAVKCFKKGLIWQERARCTCTVKLQRTYVDSFSAQVTLVMVFATWWESTDRASRSS